MSSTDDRDDLRVLADLLRETPPPAALEERVVAALRDERLIAAPAEPGRGWRRWAAAAALVVAAAGGWLARGMAAPRVAADAYGDEFLILFAEPDGLATAKPLPELVGEYRTWATGIAAERLVAGRRLERSGRRLTAGPGGETAVSNDGPWNEATGFFLIRAASWDEAIELASGSPHLGYGGEIHLRRVAQDG